MNKNKKGMLQELYNFYYVYDINGVKICAKNFKEAYEAYVENARDMGFNVEVSTIAKDVILADEILMRKDEKANGAVATASTHTNTDEVITSPSRKCDVCGAAMIHYPEGFVCSKCGHVINYTHTNTDEVITSPSRRCDECGAAMIHYPEGFVCPKCGHVINYL